MLAQHACPAGEPEYVCAAPCSIVPWTHNIAPMPMQGFGEALPTICAQVNADGTGRQCQESENPKCSWTCPSGFTMNVKNYGGLMARTCLPPGTKKLPDGTLVSSAVGTKWYQTAPGIAALVIGGFALIWLAFGKKKATPNRRRRHHRR